MLTIHNFFSPITCLTLTPASLASRMLVETSYILLDVCQPSDYLTLQKLNFSSLDSNKNWLKSTPAALTQYTLLIILASFLMNILLFLTRYLLFLNPAIHIQLRCIRPYLDLKTASTIATSIVLSSTTSQHTFL